MPLSRYGARGLLAGLALAVVVFPAGAANKATLDAEREARMRKDLYFLASPECEGRGPNTRGLDRAADYVADQFRKIGLAPAFGNSYFQPFAIPGAAGKVALTGPDRKTTELKQGVHFFPIGMDQMGEAEGEVVFAGYGVATKDPAYDDYAGVDVKGKVVVLLRDTPRATDPKRSKEMRNAAVLITKINLAQKKGAAAVLLVNDADTAADSDIPMDYSFTRLVRGGKPRSVPAIAMQRAVLQKMLPKGVTLEDVEKRIDKTLKPEAVPLAGWKAKVSVQTRKEQIPLKNVVGVLEGKGPLAKQTIVVGAHYDHLGYGGPSSLAPGKKRAIHFGADDNGSGTTGLIELARRFAAVPNREGRRIVFAAFSGEELGLHGSKYYCNNPPFPLSDTAAMFNLDMIGRLKKDAKTGQGRILTEGHGTAKPFKEMIDNLAKKHQFTLSSKASGHGPSDHDSFCMKKVPVLFFWTGTHDQYHRPTDTPDLIEYAGMRRIVDASEELVASLTRMEKPAFVQVKGGTAVRPSSGPRMQFRPKYDEDVVGIGVEGVSPGGPAERAGIKTGDVIVKIGKVEVKDFTTYFQAMAVQKPGGTTEVVVKRGGKEVKLKVTFDKE